MIGAGGYGGIGLHRSCPPRPRPRGRGGRDGKPALAPRTMSAWPESASPRPRRPSPSGGPPRPSPARCTGSTPAARSLLLDCGLFQGRRAESLPPQPRLPLPPRETSTRSSSATPTSTTAATCRTSSAQGFAGPIYCTPATRALAAVHARRLGQDPGRGRRLPQPQPRQGRAEGRAALRRPRRLPDAAAAEGRALRQAVRRRAAASRRPSPTPATCSARRWSACASTRRPASAG